MTRSEKRQAVPCGPAGAGRQHAKNIGPTALPKRHGQIRQSAPVLSSWDVIDDAIADAYLQATRQGRSRHAALQAALATYARLHRQKTGRPVDGSEDEVLEEVVDTVAVVLADRETNARAAA